METEDIRGRDGSDLSPGGARLHRCIRRQLMEGREPPAGWHLIQVRPLWADHYRVNVLMGENAATARVVQSYFIVSDGEGNIVTCHPPIANAQQMGG